MSNLMIIGYKKEYELLWNDFVKVAKNGHFFFNRGYMEYHADRFIDYSLLVFNEKNELLAVLPANRVEDVLISHGGLTFGGWIVGEKVTAAIMLDIFEQLCIWLKTQGIKKLIYKCMPYIYSKYPCEEDRYALFVNNAVLVRRDISTTIYLPSRYKYYKGRSWTINKGKKNNIHISEINDFTSYIEMENMVLTKYHGTVAVHTGEELAMLAQRFPENIHCYVGTLEEELLAGTVIFVNGDVVHTQYMANSDKGRDLGALDVVIDYLITDKYCNYKYFDFGMSNEEQGRYLNRGLARQKESFGGRSVVYDFYELHIK